MNIFYSVGIVSALNAVGPVSYHSEGFTCISVCVASLDFVYKLSEKDQNNQEGQTLLSSSNIHCLSVFCPQNLFWDISYSKKN